MCTQGQGQVGSSHVDILSHDCRHPADHDNGLCERPFAREIDLTSDKSLHDNRHVTAACLRGMPRGHSGHPFSPCSLTDTTPAHVCGDQESTHLHHTLTDPSETYDNSLHALLRAGIHVEEAETEIAFC